MDFSGERQAPRPQLTQQKQRNWAMITSLIVLAILLVLAVILFIMNQNIAKTTLPSDIKTKLTFPAYIPTELPGSYRIQTDSFSIQEEAVLLFKAVDSSGSSLFFSQQAKPKDMNFDAFYTQQIKEAKTLDDTPYATVWGKTADGTSSIMSIVADETWILLTTQAPMSESDLQTVAQSLRRQ